MDATTRTLRTWCRRVRLAGVFCTSVLVTNTRAATQQAPSPDTSTVGHTTGRDDGTVPASGITSLGYADAMNHVIDSVWGIFPVVHGHLVVRRDSAIVVADSMTRTWSVALVRAGAPHHIELFSSALLSFRTGHDAEAQRCIAEWLATPGLSAHDSAGILRTSVELFFDLLTPVNLRDSLPSPARTTIAHQYLARLEAMPRSVSAVSLFGVYDDLMQLYLSRGLVDTTIAYGKRAFTLPAHVTDYHQRFTMATTGGPLLTLALALSAYPDRYQRTMDSLITTLQSYATAPVPPIYAQYPWNMNYVAAQRSKFEGAVELVRTLGRPVPTLIATHWFNQPAPLITSDVVPGARIKPLNDGIVRLIGFGFFGCLGCQLAMKEWERFQHQLPAGAEVLFYDRSEGFWGGDLIEPAAEAEHLRHFYVERKHYTFPIAVWAGPKVANDEGGHVPLFSPTMSALGFFGGPHFIIVDGNGILRYRSDAWSDVEMLRVLTQLTRERHQTAAIVPAATSISRVVGSSTTYTPSP